MHFHPADPVEGFNVFKSSKLDSDDAEEQAEKDEDGPSMEKKEFYRQMEVCLLQFDGGTYNQLRASSLGSHITFCFIFCNASVMQFSGRSTIFMFLELTSHLHSRILQN